jgi:hypothetical protein
VGVTSAQASWLVACETRKLRPVSEPRNQDRVLLIAAKRKHSWDRTLFVSMVILLRQHPHPALPHRGGGLLLAAWIRSPKEIVFAIERHRTSPMMPMQSGPEAPVRCIARSADPGGRLASDGHRADGRRPGAIGRQRVGPQPRRREPVYRRWQHLCDCGQGEPNADDPGAGAFRLR